MMKGHDIRIRNDIRPGDIGMLTYLHGTLYHVEYGHGVEFESIVAGGMNEFYTGYAPDLERIWIAEKDGRMIGSILLKNRDDVAQLRYFLVVPEYRGIGLGRRLMQEFMMFLEASGYVKAYLWTTNELSSAAHIYKAHGFELTEEKASTAFGKNLVEQRYDLIL